jgi:hypothetical protein
LGARSGAEFWRVARKRVAHVEVVVPRQRRAQGTIRLLVSRTLAPGDVVVHRVNAGGSAGTRSDLEDAFLAIVKAAGLPEPLVNTPTLDVEADFRWPDRRLVVEVDGPGHARERAKRNDARCERILRAAEYEILRFSDVDIEQPPGHIVQTLSDAMT